MGAWGTGLFSDDVACDVRAQFRDQLEEGVSVAAATKRILAEWSEALDDVEDGPVIWLALASLQWDRGAVQARVKSKAIKLIDSGADLERWRNDGDSRQVAARRGMLRKLRQKLESPQPEARAPSAKAKSAKSSAPKRKKPVPKVEWNLGEVVAYRLKSKDWILLHIVAVNEARKREDDSPEFAVLDWQGQEFPSEKEIRKLAYRKPPETTLAWADAVTNIEERRAYCLSVAHRKVTGIPLSRLNWLSVTRRLPFKKPRGWNPGVLWRLLDRQLERDLGLT